MRIPSIPTITGRLVLLPSQFALLAVLTVGAPHSIAEVLPTQAASKTTDTLLGAPLPQVPPVDLARLKPSDFTDEELDLPYYLKHFSTVINGVVEEGPLRGYLNLSVWRARQYNQPYNARIMESILSFAYFYSLDRPWNPYRGHPAVRARLEAALDYWCRMQAPDGQFSEYGERKWNLAATAFATKFMSEALWRLKEAPAIDAAVLRRTIEANKAAIRATLTLPDLYKHGKAFTNQFGNVWGGGLSFFALYPDAELRAAWERRFHESRAAFQSPAGYYYEADGPDFGYTMSTHNYNSRQAWPFLRGTALEKPFLNKEAAWYEWLSYNATPEPDRTGYALNRGIESRQSHADFTTHDTPLAEFIPVARAYAESVEEKQARVVRERAALVANWPRVAPLEPGTMWTYSPYAFLMRRVQEWRPTTAQRDEARAQLPMLARDRFLHQRTDPRVGASFTFVRRPSYYACFAGGKTATKQQTYGLTLLWNPVLGAVLQSQSRSAETAWGVRQAGEEEPVESERIAVRYTVNGKSVKVSENPVDLPNGELSVRYAVGGGGEKTVTFGESNVTVSIRSSKAFVEQIPLLVPDGGRLNLIEGKATLQTQRGDVVIHFDPATKAKVAKSKVKMLSKTVEVVTLQAEGSLTYRIEIPR